MWELWKNKVYYSQVLRGRPRATQWVHRGKSIHAHVLTWSCLYWGDGACGAQGFEVYSLLVYLRHKSIFPGGSDGKEPAMREAWVQSLGREDPLEKEMTTHSSILAWKIPWTEEPGRLQSMGSQGIRHDWVTNTYTQTKEKEFGHKNVKMGSFRQFSFDLGVVTQVYTNVKIHQAVALKWAL